MGFDLPKGAAFDLVFSCSSCVSARAAERPLGHVNQGAQGCIDGLFVGEILGDVRREKHEIRSCSIAREIFAADAAFQFGKVVLPA